MSLSTKIDYKKKDNLTLGKCPMQGLEHALSAVKRKKIVTYLLMAPKLSNLNQKTQQLLHIHYAQEAFQKGGKQII